MLKAYKVRIYPNQGQIELMEKHFGCVRHVYNWGLELKKKHHEETGKSLSRANVQSLMVQSKKQDKSWLKEVNSQSLLASLLNLDTAFQNFFKGLAKFPRFKSKYESTQSFQCPQHVKVDFETKRLYLPKFADGIKAKFHQHFEGKIKTVTIKRRPSGKYYASILVEQEAPDVKAVPITKEQTLGLDLGLTHFLIDSEGEKVNNPRFLKRSLNKLEVAQKILARKAKGSKNRQKQKKKVATIHEKVANTRLDFLHKVSARLVFKNHATSFALEDLNIKGMVKNRKLARVITDVSWGKFVELLRYKSVWHGKHVLKIGRFEASSKVCNPCGHKLDTLPLSIRVWDCPNCSAALDRDINAAKNIRDIALADALGHSVCVKSSPEAISISVGASAKEINRSGSQESLADLVAQPEVCSQIV